MKKEVNWIKKFDIFCRVLDVLKKDVEEASERDFSSLERIGVLKNFEYVHEWSWKTLMSLYNHVGEVQVDDDYEAFRLAFQRGLIKNNAIVETGKTYRKINGEEFDNNLLDDIFYKVVNEYYDCYEELRESLNSRKRSA